jgi:single-stranded DNA-specific DHH superfamily exonuclease
VVGLEKFKFTDDALNLLGKHLGAGSTICVYGDYDVDGLMSLMIFKDMLRMVNAKVRCFPYSNRTHEVDRDFLNFCLTNGGKLAIICDSGSEDLDLLSLFVGYGIEVLVVDHHTTSNRYSSYADGVCVISTFLDKVEFGIVNVMCGAGMSFVICTAFLERMNVDYDIGCLAVYALLGMYADAIVMDTEFGRFLYQVCETRMSVPLVVEAFMDTFSVISRRFAEWWFAPKINAAFRREQFQALNQLFIEESGDAEALAKEITNLHSSTINIIREIIPRVVVSDFGKVVVCNLSEFLRENFPRNFILNHKGRVANEIAGRVGKACICVCDSGDCIEGSLRDPFGREWLKYFSPLFMAGGHPPAFGFRIPYPEWHYFESMVKSISERVSDTAEVDNEVIDMRRGLDMYVLDELAWKNEFSHVGNPPTYVLVSMRKVRQSTKYGGFSYLIENEMDSFWFSSDRQILYPMDVVLYPYRSRKTKLKAVWR